MGVRVVASNDIDQSKVVPDEIDPSKVSDIAPPSGLLRRVIGDSAVSLVKGVIGTGESLVGIADIPTLGAAGKALSAVGYDPKATREFFDEMLTPEQRAANARVQNAKGFVGTIAEAVKNPSTIAHSAIESAPMIFGGGAIARGARKLAGMGPISAAALGEGASAAGSMAEQIRQETNDGYLTPGQAGLSVVGGAATAGLTALGGKVAKRLGIADPETALAGQAVSSAEKSMMRRVPEGAISEGLLEELPQSAQEQILQNVALGKPWDEGVGESAAMGMLTGGLIGGGMNIARPGQNPVKSPGDDPVIAGLLPAPGQVPIQAGSGGFRSAEQIQAELDAERNASDIYAARAAFEASQRPPPPPPNAGLLPGPGETVIPMPPAGPAGPNLEAEAADINAGAIQAHRDAYEREQAALRDAAAAAKAPPLALPAPGAPLGNIMLPNDAGPFSVTMQHVANDAQDHANAVEAAREAEIARLEASGPIGRAAAASMRTGAAAMSGAQRAEEAAGPAESPLAIPEPVTEKAKRSQESLSKIAAELPAVTLAQAQAVAQAATDRFGEPVAVIPHPSGRGFTAVPQKAVPEDILQQFGGIQRAGGSTSPNSPTSETVVPLGGAARQRAVNEPPIQPQLPIKKREAAVAKAEKMTVETGREHEVVPHPFMRGAFAVRPVEADEYTNRGNVDTSGDRVQEANTFANRERASDLDAAANEAATSSQNDLPNPTRAQSEAGNYRKGHVKIHGLDVSIENPRHSVRVARDGSWASSMPHHYGYIRRSEGADGDHVDTFIGPNEDSDRVYVVNQINPKTGKFDEHKVMLGFSSLEAAKDGYRAAYPKDWRGMGSVVETDVAGLKVWLKNGDTKSEFRSQDGTDRSQSENDRSGSENAGAVKEANALTHGPSVHVHIKADPRDAQPPPPAIAKLVFAELPLVVTDRHDGRAIPGHLKKSFLSIIGDALRLGLPAASLDGIKSLYIKRKDTGAEYSIEGASIGLSLDTLESQYRGDAVWAATNVGNFIHEAGHHVSGGPDGESYVAASPAFAVVTVRDEAGKLRRVARGVVMTEAVDAYRSNQTMHQFLSYPLHNWQAAGGASLTHSEFTIILQEEVFAQSWALYHTNPGLLRATMPQTYSLMEEVANEARDSRSILEARQRVQRTLRSWRPEVGNQGRQGADQGDAGRPRVGQAGRGVESGRGDVSGRKEVRTKLAADEPAARSGLAQGRAGERGAAEGVREDRQRRGSDEVAPGELRGDGRSFTSFFTDATTGGRRPNSGRRYEPVIDISRTAEFSREYEKHRGNFDDHIATSIPGFRETQQAVGNAILKSLPNGGNVLDIGASEGSFIKAISALSNGRIKTVGLDPNVAMAKFFAEHSSVPGSTYEMAAFGARADEGALAWDESDGTKIHYFKPKTKFDVAHEAMTFQFISNARDAQVARVKELLKPGGVALFEQKFIPPHDEFLRNEEKKDSYKAQYYSAAELERKKKDVLERGEKAVAQEEKAKEEKVVGMHDLMVSPEEFEKTLGAHFAHVVQYWDSGNFKGYAASDNLLALKRLASNIGDLNSEYSTTKTPRDVRRRPGALDVKTDVVYRGEHGERAPNDRAKVQTRLPSISFVNNRSTADLYSRRPNDRARDAEAKSPRVIEARLNIEKPVMDRADDPFIGLDDITKAVGIKEAKRIAVKFSDQIEATNNWDEEFSSKYDSVADLVAKKPSLLGTLYFDAYKYLDDAAEVSLLKSRGYDGAIHAGNGESADDVEYKVFSESQIEDAGAKRPSTLEAQDSGSGPRSATVGAERGDRVTGRKFLSGADKLKIARDGAKLGLSKKEIRDLQAQARSDMSRFPPKDGWVPIEIIGVERKPKTLSSGDVVYVNAVKYRPVPYKFNVPPGSERATGKIDEAWAKKVAAAGVNEILDIYRRAKAGDAVAQNIVAHASWYRAMVVRLREEFGAAGDFYADLLGATSPNTPVETNWRFAIDIIKRFSRGEFQTEMRDFEKWIADGRSPSEFPAERKIRQLSEKLYGMNSTNGMLAIANLWRNIEPGMAPKARNFALNLIGQSNMATIDVWAARFLRRMANSIRGSVGQYRRIPTVAEQGVTGKWNASATAVTGEFGFGANVMQKMSDALAAHGIDLSPPDLQAVSWFVEKELWTKSGWTSAQGEGGSFEAEADKAGLERFMAAWSIQVGNNRPADAEVQMEAARLLATVRSDDDVTAARAVPTIGMYDAESHERSFDTEITAGPNWSPWAFIGELSRIAKERKQDAIYFSRVLKPNEENDNARPGIEIYFKTERDLQSTLPLIRSLTADGQQGFTLTVDPRSEMPGGAQAEKFNGIRIQFVPEFEIRFGGPGAEALASGDRERVAAIIAAKTIELGDIVDKVMREDGVALARKYDYDTLVVTKEDYDDYTDAATGDRAESSREGLRGGQPLHEVLEDAARRYESGRRQEPEADIPFGQADGSGRDPTGEGFYNAGVAEGQVRRPGTLEAQSPISRVIAASVAADRALTGDGARAITAFVGHGPDAAAALKRGADPMSAIGFMHKERLEAAFSPSASGADLAARQEIERAFAPVREVLRKEFGDTIRLYRYQQPVGDDAADRNVLSWTASRSLINKFAGREARAPISAEQIADVVADFERNGYAKVGRDKFKRTAEGFVALYHGNGFITDYESIDEALKQRRDLDRDAQSAALNRVAGDVVLSKDVSVDDIVWVTNRANQQEFIVKNSEPAKRPGTLSVESDTVLDAIPDPLWYSRLAAGLAKAPWSKSGDMPAGQLKMWLNARAKDGALPGEELKWSGVTEWIDTLIEGGNRRISRTEVEKFLDQNGVKVEEKMRGYNHVKPKRQVWVRYDNERGDAQIHKVRSIDDPRSEYRKDVESEIAWWSDENGNRISSDEARKIARAWEKYWSTQEWPKYDAHVLPGGENYAELLLKLPTRPEDAGRYDLPRGHTVYHPDHHYPYRWRHIDGAGNPIGPDFSVEPNTPQAAARFAADRFYGGGRPNRQPGAFRSAHFDEPNILAHVRFNERIDADGNRILFLEEVQSDWAQKGREEGFSSKSSGEVRESEHADGKFAVYVNGTIRIDGLPTRQIAEAELKLMLESDHHQGIPVAPFVTKTEAWVALALKRMIRYAADGGFDGIAWTNGEQQVDRYDLSKQISEIKWSAGETRAAGFKVSLSAYYPEGGLIEEIGLKMYRPEELAGVIGKELSDRIRKSIDGGVLEGEFSGLDLKVGGEGMRAFYDKIVPNVANDLLKKMGGARVGEVALDDTEARDFRVWLPDVNEYHNRTFKHLSEAQDFAAKIGGVVRSPERATLTQPGFYLTPEILPKAKRPQALFAQTSLAERATETIGDALRTQRSFNLWDRTVGTQFHKAWKDPDFKKVYDGVQSYLNDASFLMTKAADLAPDVLPKLEGIRGILGATASKADLEAMSHAIFDGTLEDVVYTDDQLRSRGLSPKAIVLYRQTRAAIDKSLTDVFVSEAVKEAKGLLPADVLARARREGDPWIVVDALSAIPVDQRSEVQQQVYDQLRKRVFKIEELKQKGYAPLMRFGQYTVHMADANGGSLSFTMHETEREANAVARALRAENPQHRVTQGVLAEDAWQLFQGISPDTLEIFAESVGASEKQLFQKYLKLATNNRSTLRRLIQRKKIPGFSPDAQRALAQFVTSNGRAASRNYNWGAVLKAANDVPKERGDVKDEAVRLAQYVQHPGEEAGGLRGLLFVQFLGGSVASALTNATQPILMTFPYLSRFGAAKAAAELVRAAKVAVGGQPAEADLRDAMNRAAREGIIAPHEVAGLYAESIRNLGSNLVVRRVLRAWGSLFSLAEAFNRRITFAAAYRLARDAGESDPYRFAVNAIAETQGVYNRGNRPDWARGAVGATIFTFKQYSIAYVEFVRRLPPKQRALALAVLVLAAGLQGLPGADDLEDVLDTIAESLGYSWNSKKAMREWAIRTLGNSAGGLLVGGFSGLPGVPIDVQARLGLGNLIPGTGLLKRSNPDKGREVLEVFGPAGSQAKSLVDAVGAAQEGNAGQVARSMLPLAIQNAMKAVDMVSTGYYSDTRGRRVIDVDAYEAAIKGIGVQPRRVGDVQRRRQDLQQDISLQRSIEEEVSDLWARGIIERDPSKIDRARAKLVDWNLTNPGSRVTISPLQIQRRVQQAAMTADQRFIKTAPPELRARVAEELR